MRYIIVPNNYAINFLLQTGAMQRIVQQTQNVINIDNIGERALPRLCTIMDGAYGSMQYLRRFDRMVVGQSDPFDSGHPSTSNVPFQTPGRRVPSHTGPSSSRGRQRRHDQHDGPTVVEPSVQVTGMDTGHPHTPPVQQFTAFAPSPVPGVDRGMAARHHVSGDMFIPQPASMTIGAQATSSQQFPPFAVPPTPVAGMYGFDPRFPSSSQLPPYEHVPMTGDFSSHAALHPIFTLLSGTGGTSSSLELPDYYSLGQPSVFPSTNQRSYASDHVSTGDFVTYRSTNDSESSDTSDALETDDVDPDSGSRDDPSARDYSNHPGVVIGERQRRRPKRFCCPSS